MKTNGGRKGFSIVELLVTLAVSGTLVALLSRGYIVQKRSAESESGLRDMNLRTQLAMNQIKKIIRNAGLGAEENLTHSTGTFNGENQTFTSVFTLTPRNDGPDALTVVTGYPARSYISCTQDTGTCTENCTEDTGTCVSANIDVDETEHFDTVNGKYIFVAPSIRNGYREVQSIVSDTLTLNASVTVHNNDPVYRVAAHTIALDRHGDGTVLDVDGDGSTGDGDYDPGGVEIPDLYIYDNLVDPDDETLFKLSEGVEDVQFQYIVDSDGNGLIEGAEWTPLDNVPANNLGDIRAVRIWLLVRSNHPDANHEDTHEDGGAPNTYQVADHQIQLDTNDVNGIDSPFDYRYHRLLSVETVMVRNRNL